VVFISQVVFDNLQMAICLMLQAMDNYSLLLTCVVQSAYCVRLLYQEPEVFVKAFAVLGRRLSGHIKQVVQWSAPVRQVCDKTLIITT